MSSPVSSSAPFFAQVASGASLVLAGSYQMLQNMGPCYTAGPQGYVVDPNRGLSLPSIIMIGGSLFVTGVVIANKVHRLFFQTQLQRA